MAVTKDTLGLSASALSKQVAALVDAGYVAQERSQRDSRRIWLTLTPQGKKACRNHVRALQEIVAGSADRSQSRARGGVSTFTRASVSDRT